MTPMSKNQQRKLNRKNAGAVKRLARVEADLQFKNAQHLNLSVRYALQASELRELQKETGSLIEGSIDVDEAGNVAGMYVPPNITLPCKVYFVDPMKLNPYLGLLKKGGLRAALYQENQLSKLVKQPCAGSIIYP